MTPRKKGNESGTPTQIIIKKKLYDHEGGHHGGTWKIAYADFMTAMMTFFLVMWLINTASKEQITKLASYFNPVKLSDRNPAKGVHDIEAGATEETTEAKKAEKKAEKPSKKSEAEKKPDTEKKPETEKHQSEDEQLFSNPFGVLTQLASQAEGAMAVAVAQGQAGNTMSGGASHDPFITDPVISQSPGRTAPAASPIRHAEARCVRCGPSCGSQSGSRFRRETPQWPNSARAGRAATNRQSSGGGNSTRERAGPPHGLPAQIIPAQHHHKGDRRGGSRQPDR